MQPRNRRVHVTAFLSRSIGPQNVRFPNPDADLRMISVGVEQIVMQVLDSAKVHLSSLALLPASQSGLAWRGGTGLHQTIQNGSRYSG